MLIVGLPVFVIKFQNQKLGVFLTLGLNCGKQETKIVFVVLLIFFSQGTPNRHAWIISFCRTRQATAAAAAATEAATPAANPTTMDLDIPVDPNEPTYCFCNSVSYGEMVACDNPNVRNSSPLLF